MIPLIENVGSFFVRTFSFFKSLVILLLQTLYWVFWGPFRKKPPQFEHIMVQTVFGGVHSVLIVCFVNFAMGIVLAMQSAYQLEQLGATIFVAALVAVSMAREIGPVLTALVIAGRVGAAITAEISSMKVSEQIEALETLALNPVRYLVVPRFLALLIMLPCLVLLADFSGMLGGFLIGVHSLELRPSLYIDTTIEYLVMKDVMTGLYKSIAFSTIIAMIACHQGLTTHGGAQGVGRATTNSVVLSFVFIIVADAILTAIFYFSGS